MSEEGSLYTIGQARTMLRRALAGANAQARRNPGYTCAVHTVYPPREGERPGLRICPFPIDTIEIFAAPMKVSDQLEQVALAVTSQAGQAACTRLLEPGLIGLVLAAAALYAPYTSRHLIDKAHGSDKIIGAAAFTDGAMHYAIYDVAGDSVAFVEPDELGSLHLEPMLELLYAIESMIDASPAGEAERAAARDKDMRRRGRVTPPEQAAAFRWLPDAAVGARDRRFMGPQPG